MPPKYSVTSTSPKYRNLTFEPTQPSPFSLGFSWEGRSVSIMLKNGNDVFKLANAFMGWLDSNEIEYNVKTTKPKKSK
jgi:hypothetical protein